MRRFYNIILLGALLTIPTVYTAAQSFQGAHKDALDSVFVETYYVADATDAADTDGGTLAEGATTYRIYMMLKRGYEVRAVYGNETNPLRIATTTEFFNNEDRGESTAGEIRLSRLEDNTVALDSWLSIGAVSESAVGAPACYDLDGSVIGGTNNDNGLITNNVPCMSTNINENDGMHEIDGTVKELTVVGDLNLDVLGTENHPGPFETDNGSWAMLGGFGNDTLIQNGAYVVAQLTTTGVLEAKLNIFVQVKNSHAAELCVGTDGVNNGECSDAVRFVWNQVPDDSLVLSGPPTQPTSVSAFYKRADLSITSAAPCQRLTECVAVSNNEAVTYFHAVFPNPVDNHVSVVLDAAWNNRTTTYRISDMLGVNYESGNLESGQKIDLSELPNGIYLLTLTSEKGQTTTQIIKE